MKGTVNARAKKKVWLVLYTCRNTKALDIMVVDGYDTESFLLKHEEYVARRGEPLEVQVDAGSQLKKASKVLGQSDTVSDSLTLDVEKISSRTPLTKWTVLPPGAQHRNGLPEAMVKQVKRALYRSIPAGDTLTFPEMLTLVAKICNSINSRPLGVHYGSTGVGEAQPLTVNQLLLGRSSTPTVPVKCLSDETVSQRLQYVEKVHQVWWNIWSTKILPTMLPARKWVSQKDNVKIRDICLLLYKGRVKDEYRLVKVLECHTSKDGLVRTVTVGYKRRDLRNTQKIAADPSQFVPVSLVKEKVHVQRLAVLQHLQPDHSVSGERRCEN